MPHRMRVSVVLVILALSLAPVHLDAAQDQAPPARRRLTPAELLPVDATAFGLAAATGGDFYFWSPGEFADAAATLRIPLGGEALLLSYDDLGRSGTRTFRVPVDGAVERLELFCGAQRLDHVRVTRPSGLTLGDGDPTCDAQQFERMRIFGVDRPEPGAWLVELAGAGRYALTVHARLPGSKRPPGTPEPVALVDFDFVARGGRPGHEGLFPLERTPPPGAEVLLEIDYSGTLREVEVQLVDLAGTPLSPPLFPLIGGADEDSLHVPLVVPARAFRAVVRGFDRTGLAAQRVFSNSVDPNAAPSNAIDVPLKD